MKAIEQYIHEVLFIIQGGSNFKFVDKTLVYDHSNESYCAVLSLQVNVVKAIFFSPLSSNCLLTLFGLEVIVIVSFS